MMIFGYQLKWPAHHFIFDLFQFILMASFLLNQRKQWRKKFMPDGGNRKNRIIQVKDDCFLFHNQNRLFKATITMPITPTISSYTRRWLFQSAHRVLEETGGYSFDVPFLIIFQWVLSM